MKSPVSWGEAERVDQMVRNYQAKLNSILESDDAEFSTFFDAHHEN
jgi:hypothetical protein